MKQLFTIMCIWLIYSCNAQQRDGFIQMHINVIEENKHFNDNNTIVKVNCLNDNIEFKDTSSNFIFIMQPNKEYILTFIRPNCLNKSILVSTINIPKYNDANLKVTINMQKGYINNTSLIGEISYNKSTGKFEKKLFNNTN